jgi:hypothetical protein
MTMSTPPFIPSGPLPRFFKLADDDAKARGAGAPSGAAGNDPDADAGRGARQTIADEASAPRDAAPNL